MSSMRQSRLIQKMRRGEKVISFKLNTSCSRTAAIAAAAGFDALWLCYEHVPNDLRVIESQINAAKAFDVDTIVRVSKGSYSDYIRPLEADAAGIMVPHLMSLAEAETLVKMTKFHPLGRRPYDGGNADALYCQVSQADYFKEANAERLVIVQIEDPEPLSELDAIAALPGIDMLFFGPGDFSQAIGYPGQMDHPEIDRVRHLVADTARRHGKFSGTVSGADTLDEYFAMGYDYLNCGADVVGLGNYCSSIINRFLPLRPQNAPSDYYQKSQQ